MTRFRAEIAALDEHWQGRTIAVILGAAFLGSGPFSTTSGNITDDVILQYLQKHEPTGASR
jgi:hypothetical protein